MGIELCNAVHRTNDIRESRDIILLVLKTVSVTTNGFHAKCSNDYISAYEKRGDYYTNTF